MAYDFDKIARTYDRLNRVMTLGLDRRWRKRAVREFSILNSQFSILDVACGTGEMLSIARQKTASATSHLSPFTFHLANAEALPFPDATFDAVTCAFGVRNFVHLEKGLAEMLRVLKPGGRMVILELATPDNPLIKPFYNLYTRRIIPLLGKWLAGNREAYTYLPESIAHFPKGNAFLSVLGDSVAEHATEKQLTFGVCRLYIINKEDTGLSVLHCH